MFFFVILILICKSEANNEPRHEISNNVVGVTSKASDQPAHGQSDWSLC